MKRLEELSRLNKTKKRRDKLSQKQEKPVFIRLAALAAMSVNTHLTRCGIESSSSARVAALAAMSVNTHLTRCGIESSSSARVAGVFVVGEIPVGYTFIAPTWTVPENNVENEMSFFELNSVVMRLPVACNRCRCVLSLEAVADVSSTYSFKFS